MKLFAYICQACKHKWYSEDLVEASRCPKCWDWAGVILPPINVTKDPV